MSEQIQKNAKERAERARMREENTRARARNNHERGEHRLAKLHESSAHAQADAARAAEATITADQNVEGNQLDGSD
jgi:hypothetical protein